MKQNNINSDGLNTTSNENENINQNLLSNSENVQYKDNDTTSVTWYLSTEGRPVHYGSW